MGPRSWIKDSEKIWADENSNEGAKNDFIDQYLSANERFIHNNVKNKRWADLFSGKERDHGELEDVSMVSKENINTTHCYDKASKACVGYTLVGHLEKDVLVGTNRVK